ncbi:hypothetical protein Taro_023291 [Colocasia esculenta]|uniref:Saposin B-type domain-containing protein n=1 Tax=Colocasia esculenta TaxID=4460 RepID=A0A843VGZ1_COLES|nr:hypothetical protein [Colocasia esculenta]
MKMGATPFFLSLALLLSVASARDRFMSINANDAERNRLSMEDTMDLYELAKVYEDEISSFLGSPTEFTETCLEISRKAKEGIKDHSIINEIDSLASTLCYILPSDLEAELKGNGTTCTVCRGIIDGISTALGDTDKQLVIILYLIKACKIQTFADQCKRMVFTFGPATLTALKALVSKDLCYTVKICDEARNVTEYASLYDDGNFGQYQLQNELGNLDLM